jgi:hypothetical protein
VIAAVLSGWTQEFVELWRDVAAVWRRGRRTPEIRKPRRRTHRERSAGRYHGHGEEVNTHASFPLHAARTWSRRVGMLSLGSELETPPRFLRTEPAQESGRFHALSAESTEEHRHAQIPLAIL